MERYKKFLILWTVNSSLLCLAIYLSPQNYTLGNSFLTVFQAASITGLFWSFGIWYAGSFFEDLEINMKSSTNQMIAYFAVNFALLWFLARFAVITGFGVSSWIYVFGLALVAILIQYFAWKLMQNRK